MKIKRTIKEQYKRTIKEQYKRTKKNVYLQSCQTDYRDYEGYFSEFVCIAENETQAKNLNPRKAKVDKEPWNDDFHNLYINWELVPKGENYRWVDASGLIARNT